METFKMLIEQGNIGFYQSCEVTQIFIDHRQEKKISNFFILATIEEKPYTGSNPSFLGRYKLDPATNICILRYHLSLQEIADRYLHLKQNGRWKFENDESLQLGKLKPLSKQFIPSAEGNRINKVLKNNFHSGSYLLEFFDEEKKVVWPLLSLGETRLKELSDFIYSKVPLDLSVVQDRIGNVLFQFPITIVDVKSQSLAGGDGVRLFFSWHKNLSMIPDCDIELDSSMDKNLLSAQMESYNKGELQEIITGNSDSVNHIRLWRKGPGLLLCSFSGTYIRSLNFDMNIISGEPRLFEIDKNLFSVTVSTNEGTGKRSAPSYLSYISAQVNNAEKKVLTKSLSFKQYNNYGHEEALKDLRTLIKKHGGNGIYLWDPFLSAEDILRTLFFSETIGAPLRAIGCIDKTVKQVYKQKKQTPKQIFAAYRKVLDNPNHNNYGLSLEFRIQYGIHGWSFHDRFLIFPGTITNASRVYSLGTSLNSFGKRHHILQEVSYPQPVIDAFNELWIQLDKPECIVWKYPKT
jgi:hypothetical protein